jgi:hypothetical protein
MFRQLFLAFSASVQPDDPHAQTIFIVAVLMSYFGAACYYWPWKSREINLCEIFSMLGLALFILAGGAFIPTTSSRGTYIGVMIFAFVITILGLVIIVMRASVAMFLRGPGDTFERDFWAAEEKRRMLSIEWYELCITLSALTPELMAQLLTFMSSHDRRQLVETMSMCYSLNTSILQWSHLQETIIPQRISNIPTNAPHLTCNDTREQCWDDISARMSASLSERTCGLKPIESLVSIPESNDMEGDESCLEPKEMVESSEAEESTMATDVFSCMVPADGSRLEVVAPGDNLIALTPAKHLLII